MAYTDLTSATRRQLAADLAEAAGRGVNGSVDAIVASFEEELASYLQLDDDLKRAYPRGETARVFGTALGEALVREHGFRWAMLSDDYGTDLVVVRGDKYTAPLVVVHTRFDDEETGKLTTFVGQFL
ncbi:DUF3806 domain-containing protein [Corynebacterium auris]|uniref:DUF3806 domain-containing protein n=1 Tax=Corynebacterium auris TaxID=44750 RepID=UPI0025B47CAA|nr:DUF3806 domain-containing protein [Corynebacterium auris]WJY67649.1 hypothetical protein CAURIS_03655 [Corynebacterium auris]